jgi:hypothetical protein
MSKRDFLDPVIAVLRLGKLAEPLAQLGGFLTPEHIFTVSGILALFGWAVLIIMPGHRTLVESIAWRWVPGLLSLAYAFIILPRLFAGGFGVITSPAALAEAIGQPWLLIAGWLQYLAFDPLVGAWQVTIAQKKGSPTIG